MSLKAPTGFVRGLLAVSMMVAALAFAGCGDDEDSGGATTAGAGTKSGLGADRFKALETVYVAEVPIDKIADDAPPSAMDGMLKDYVEKCNALDTDDALLAAYRRFCPIVAELRESLAAAGGCEGEDGVQECIDGVSKFRGVVRTFLRDGKRYDAAVKREELTLACEKALINPERGYEIMRDYSRAFAHLERALTDASEADLTKAEAIMKRAESRAEGLPDAAHALKDFRSGCA